MRLAGSAGGAECRRIGSKPVGVTVFLLAGLLSPVLGMRYLPLLYARRLIVGVALIAAASSPAGARLPSHGADTAVQIGPNTFVFPRNARDFLPDKSGKIEALSLRVQFPSMIGRTPETAHELSLARPEARTLQILLTDSTFNPAQVGRTAARDVRRALVTRIAVMEVWNASLETIFQGFVRTPVLDGLMEISLLERPVETGSKLGAQPHGLSALRAGARYYAEIEQEHIKTVLICSGTRPVPNPQCEMYFEYQEIRVKNGLLPGDVRKLESHSECIITLYWRPFQKPLKL